MHERIEAGRWLDLFTRLVADGRQVGVHFVITADRRTSVPMALVSALPRRLVLRMSSDEEYANAGEPMGILSATSPGGRAVVEGQEVQIGVLGGSGNGERQAAAIAVLSERLRAGGVPPAPGVGVLPEELHRDALGVASTPDRAVFAVGDRDLTARGLALTRGHVLVTGPPRSGKTTALATIAQAVAAARLPLFHVHVRPTALANAPFWGRVARGPDDGGQLLERVAAAVPELGKRVVLVVDDLGELADTAVDEALGELLRLGREHPVTIVAAVDNTLARRQYSGAIPELRKDGVAVLLQPDTDSDGDIAGVVLPRRAPGAWPEGRGYLAERGTAELVQVALPDPW
jgi:S-DNA-T family DNA segregation ATPase FtsK/SpoIIIE